MYFFRRWEDFFGCYHQQYFPIIQLSDHSATLPGLDLWLTREGLPTTLITWLSPTRLSDSFSSSFCLKFHFLQQCWGWKGKLDSGTIIPLSCLTEQFRHQTLRGAAKFGMRHPCWLNVDTISTVTCYPGGFGQPALPAGQDRPLPAP